MIKIIVKECTRQFKLYRAFGLFNRANALLNDIYVYEEGFYMISKQEMKSKKIVENGVAKSDLKEYLLGKELIPKYVVIFVVILLAQIINIIYWGSCKEGYFGDELYSYQFVCQTEYPSINANRPEKEYLNNWHSSEYYQDYLSISDDEAFDIIGVYNSIKSDVHPPLYYILLHVMCSIFKDFTKWSEIALNLLFFVVTSIILYAISRKVIQSGWGQLVPNLIYGFSVGAVTTAVFGRMYMQLTCATLLFVYLHVLLIEEVKVKEKLTKKIWIGILGTTIFGVLTQYYFLIFAFFLCACIWLFFVLNKKINVTIEYTITMFLGLLSSLAIWPYMYKQVFGGYRGDEAFENLKSVSVFSYLRDFIKLISNALFAGKLKIVSFFLIILILIGFFLHIFQVECLSSEMGRFHIEISKKKIQKINIVVTEQFFRCFFIFVALVLDIAVIAKISPYRSDRYILNIYPIAILVLVVFVINLCEWITKKQGVKLLCFIVMLVITIDGYFGAGVGYLYKGTGEKLEIAKSYADLPVILLTENNARFTSCNEAIYFQDGQKVYPTDESGIAGINVALDEVGEGSFILYVDKYYDDVDSRLNAVKENVNADNSKWIYSTNKCAVYLIERGGN